MIRLKVGDFVRVSGGYTGRKCQEGDKGTIIRVQLSVPSDLFYYLVTMDKNSTDHKGIVFLPDEIELDA